MHLTEEPKKWYTYNFATELQSLFAIFAAKLKI